MELTAFDVFIDKLPYRNSSLRVDGIFHNIVLLTY